MNHLTFVEVVDGFKMFELFIVDWVSYAMGVHMYSWFRKVICMVVWNSCTSGTISQFDDQSYFWVSLISVLTVVNHD